MRAVMILILALPMMCGGAGSPYECPAEFDWNTPVNQALFRHWTKHDCVPAVMASDAVFLRRVALTVAGRLPTAAETRAFLADKRPDKRAAAIEKFLDSPEYADMQAMRFADMLRIKSEFPINLWPNAVQLWHRAIRDDLAADRPLGAMFREMLTASGSNFRVPHANFFRASADRSPRGLAATAMLTVMGMRLERLAPERAEKFAVLFSRIRFKSTHEWKEEIVYTDYRPVQLEAVLPDGAPVSVASPETDPRQVFAAWLAKRGDGYFCRAVTNRVWHWVFGRGIYPVADDLPMVPAGGAVPFCPELQEVLNTELRTHRYSLRHLYRVILNSAAFQAASAPGASARTGHFAAYPVHRLEAEVVVDALASVLGGYDRYMSVIPEPFTFLPPRTRAVTIADGSISTGVLDNFGRPPRDAGTLDERNAKSSESQNLYLMNSAGLSGRINRYCRGLQKRYRKENDRLNGLFLELMSRYPTEHERAVFRAYQRSMARKEQFQAWTDTVWVLVNSKEFLFYH